MGALGRRLFLTGVIVGVAIDVATYGTKPGDALYTATYVTICSMAWWAASRLPAGPERRPWLLIALAQTLWFVGDATELVQFYFATVPDVGIADVFWLSGYPLVAVGLTLMARRRAPGRLRGGVLDALALTVAAAAAAWQFLIEPVLGPGYSVLATVVPALYPVCDVILLAGILFVALSPGTRGAPTRLLLGAVLLYLATDLGYNILPYLVAGSTVDRIGPLIMLANALLVSACLHPKRAELTSPGDRMPSLHPARVLFLGLALMTAPTLTLMHAGFGREEITALVATATCAGFILARFTIAVREQERTQLQLTHQAQHDPLTGLANRAQLGDRLGRLLPSADGPVAVLYLDLDGFKQINDVHGHEAGDLVLTVVARRLSQAVRGTDLVARLGGDEFVLLCPDLPTDDAVRLAERILRDVALPVTFRGMELAVGASVGVAAYGADVAQSTAGVLRAADAAMYEAKRRGRGCWVLNDNQSAGLDGERQTVSTADSR
jgi:diguanylate cyclase (GGDEF)-like protein